MVYLEGETMNQKNLKLGLVADPAACTITKGKMLPTTYTRPVLRA
jgi:hypothetical protein